MNKDLLNELKLNIKDLNLDLPLNDILKFGNLITNVISDHFEEIQNDKKLPTPKITPEVLAKKLISPLPLEGSDPFNLLEECKNEIIPNSTHMGHSKFFGYIPNTTTIIPTFVDALVSALNQNLAVWIASPAATIIERLVISWIAQIVGFPSSTEGLLTTGGSMASLIAINIARHDKCPWDISQNGMIHRMPVYISEESHNCIKKSVELLGIGTNQLRLIPTNDNFKIDTEKLIEAIENDIHTNNVYPFCIIGHAGTVNTGTIDPLNELADIAKTYNLWFHIDAAYGGFANLSKDGKKLLSGIEKADSIALDPHKWLFIPIETGCILIKNGSLLQNTFSQLPPYILDYRSDLDGFSNRHNFHEYGFQMTRRFRGLRIWFALKHHGVNKYSQIIQQNIDLTKYLEQLIYQSQNLQNLSKVELSICCFRYNPYKQSHDKNTSINDDKYLNVLNKKILEELNHKNTIYLSSTVLDKKFALRTCITNYRTTKSDIELLIQIVEELGDSIHNSDEFNLF